MPVHHRKRALDPARKGKADLIQLVREFFDHQRKRAPVHQPHLAHLFGQCGL
jgi:hypothetical protein